MDTNAREQRILLVDDETPVLSAVARLLRPHLNRASRPVKVDAFTDPLQALERASRQTWDVVVSDYRMPNMDGVAFLRRLGAIVHLLGEDDDPPRLHAVEPAAERDWNRLVRLLLCRHRRRREQRQDRERGLHGRPPSGKSIWLLP